MGIGLDYLIIEDSDLSNKPILSGIKKKLKFCRENHSENRESNAIEDNFCFTSISQSIIEIQ